MPTQEEIQKNIEESRAKYHKMKQKHQVKKDEEKAYTKFAHENEMYIFCPFDTKVTAGFIIDGNIVKFAFSFLSKKDEYSSKVAKRVIAKRIVTQDKPFYGTFKTSIPQDDETFIRMIDIKVQSAMYDFLDEKSLPSHIRKNLMMYL